MEPGRDVSSVEVFGFLGWITTSVAYSAWQIVLSLWCLWGQLMYTQTTWSDNDTMLFDAVLFILWAFVPDEVLHRHGITYYPSRYWAMAIPTWLCVTVLFLYLAYAW